MKNTRQTHTRNTTRLSFASTHDTYNSHNIYTFTYMFIYNGMIWAPSKTYTRHRAQQTHNTWIRIEHDIIVIPQPETTFGAHGAIIQWMPTCINPFEFVIVCQEWTQYEDIGSMYVGIYALLIVLCCPNRCSCSHVCFETPALRVFGMLYWIDNFTDSNVFAVVFH